MIKATGDRSDGRKVLLIGLSRRNCEMLLEGKPIQFDSRDYKIDGGPIVVVMAGETEQAIAATLPQADKTRIKAHTDKSAEHLGGLPNELRREEYGPQLTVIDGGKKDDG